MKFLPQILTSAATIAVTCAVTAFALYYKNRRKEINELMVFCKLQLNAYYCFDKLISYVESAQESLCVCMPSIHNPAIQARIVKLIKEKKIKVRIIINLSGYKDSTEFLLKELIDAGKCLFMYLMNVCEESNNSIYYRCRNKMQIRAIQHAT